jgi:SAM-dependent methyltransferase
MMPHQYKNLDYFRSAAPSWVRYRNSHSYYWNSINDYLKYFIHEDDTVLEIGCGTGDLLAALPARKKTGIDYCEELIDQAKAMHQNIDFKVMPAEDLSLDSRYDVIILSNLIGLLDDIEHVFLQLHKVSHTHTRIIVTYHSNLWEPLITLAERIGLKRKMPKQNWLSSNDIINLLSLAGFETYRHNRSMLIPFGIPIVSRFINRFISRLPLIQAFSLNQFVFARPAPVPFPQGWEDRYSVSVVIPARNESGNIEEAVRRVPNMGKTTEIIFVEGNSTDNTWEVICEVEKKYGDRRTIRKAQQDGKGKGDAVRKGYSMATGDILMILDADLTVMPEDLPKFYHALSTGKGEFINGVRLVYPMEKGAMRSLNTIGNHFFSTTFSWLMERPVKDTLCGTKVMFKTDYQKLARNRSFFGEFDPFGDFDLLFGAHKLNLKIIDLPIRYKERKYGETNISRFKHGLLLLKMSAFAALKIKFR